MNEPISNHNLCDIYRHYIVTSVRHKSSRLQFISSTAVTDYMEREPCKILRFQALKVIGLYWSTPNRTCLAHWIAISDTTSSQGSTDCQWWGSSWSLSTQVQLNLIPWWSVRDITGTALITRGWLLTGTNRGHWPISPCSGQNRLVNI